MSPGFLAYVRVFSRTRTPESRVVIGFVLEVLEVLEI